jgi:hypothetical protein
MGPRASLDTVLKRNFPARTGNATVEPLSSSELSRLCPAYIYAVFTPPPQKKNEENKNVDKNSKYTFVYVANTGKDCDLLHDRPVLSTGRTPHDTKPQLSWQPDSGHEPRGAECQDGLNDYHDTTLCHNSEDLDLKHHRFESIKTRFLICRSNVSPPHIVQLSG